MKAKPQAELHIHGIKDVVLNTERGGIVLQTEATVKDQRTELEIAVTAELVPAIALALLATTAQARAARDDLEPALDVLGAAVVPSGSNQNVRLQLLFDKGAVLPLEMTTAAARALFAGLVEAFYPAGFPSADINRTH
jgi:hypothetical protein